MITGYDLKHDEVEEIDQELKNLIDVEVHEPFLKEEFSKLITETETAASNLKNFLPDHIFS